MYKKIYPKVSTKGGLKFVLDYKGNILTMRFAGNPLFLLEKLYTNLGGKDFMEVYSRAKNNPKTLTKEERINLDAAKQLTNLFLNTLADIEKPFVIYTDEWVEDGVE